MEDYDEYMKKHLMKVKQQSFGFGRARSNFTSTTASSATTSSSSLSQGNADGASFSFQVGEGRTPDQRITSSATNSTSNTSSTNGRRSSSNNENSEPMDTAPCGSVAIEDRSDSCVGEEEMAANPVSDEEKDGCPVSNEEGRNQAMVVGPKTIDESAVAIGDSLENSCNQVVEPADPESNLNNSDVSETQSMPVSDVQDVISKPSPVLVTAEHNYAAPLDSMIHTEASTSSQPCSFTEVQGSTQPTTFTQNTISTQPSCSSTQASNSTGAGNAVTPSEPTVHVEAMSASPGHSDGIETGTGGNLHSESNVSPWNGIRTRRQVRLVSSDNVSVEDSSQRQDPPQPLRLPPQRAEGAEEEAVQVNIMDVDESSQDSQNMLSSLVYSLGFTEHETKQAISLWHNRTIIPPLDPTDLTAELAKRTQLYQEEQENFELQSRKAELLEVPVS